MVIIAIFIVLLLRSALNGECNLRDKTAGLGVLMVGASHSLVDFSI